MRRAEKIMKGKVAFRREMDLVLPKATSDALWQEATRRLDGFLTRYGSLPKGVHMHTDKRILPAAAVYLTIRDAVGRKEAYRIIEDAAIRNCKPIAAKLMRLMRLPGMRSLFVQAWDPLTRKLFGPKNGFENVFYPRKKGEFRMDVVSRPYCRYLTELGCPELTRIFCENDERIYGNLPHLTFMRTSTLGKGAKRCDFYLRET